MKTVILLCFIFEYVLFGCVCEFLENRNCFHKIKRRQGECNKLAYCPQDVIALRHGVYPQVCKFENLEVEVCCVPVNNDTHFFDTSVVGGRSQKVCHAYEHLSHRLEKESKQNDTYKYKNICKWTNDTENFSSMNSVKPGTFPHLALIGYKTRKHLYFQCAGTLISPKFVLTAAHCLVTRYYDKATHVRFGDLQYANPDDDAHVQQIKIKRYVRHPNYTYPMRYHDLALLELERRVNLSVFVKPICLYNKPEEEGFEKAIVGGWGNFESNDLERDTLLQSRVTVVDALACNLTFVENKRLFPRGVEKNYQFCAASHINDENICYGDEGGPIQIFHNQVHCSYYLVGVASIADNCDKPDLPILYTKVYPYLEWIESIVWPLKLKKD